MRAWGLILAGGGLGGLALAGFGWARAAAVERDTRAAIAAGGQIRLRLTGYWPATARPDERRMEGGMRDRKGNPLHSVEDYLAGKAPWVSLSGDDKAWPYGQRVIIPWVDGKTIEGRVVDTGRNFRGSTKVYRAFGAEPIDVNVYSAESRVPRPPIVTATIVKGDHLDKPGREIAAAQFQGQDVVVGALEMLGAADWAA